MADEMNKELDAAKNTAEAPATAKQKAPVAKEKTKKKRSGFVRFFCKIGHGFKRIGRFLKDCKSEMKKVVWYGRKQTINNSLVVLVTMIIVGAIITGLDIGLLALIKLLAEAI